MPVAPAIGRLALLMGLSWPLSPVHADPEFPDPPQGKPAKTTGPVSVDDHGALVTFRATSALPDTAIDFIARNAVPTRTTIPANQSPEEVVRTACGSFTNAYRDVLVALNPNLILRREPAAREIALPACPKWQRNVATTIRPDDTLDTVLLRETGRGPDDLLRVCDPGEVSSRCDRTLRQIVERLNPGVPLNDLPPGKALTLPVVSTWTTFQVRPDLGLTALEFIQSVSETVKAAPRTDGADPIVANAPATEGIQLIRPSSATDPKSQTPACQNPQTMSPTVWPFDAATVSAVVTRTRGKLADRGWPEIVAGIAIVDTGLEGLGTTFPEKWFQPRRGELRGFKDNDNNGWAGDYYGITVYKRSGDLKPDPGYPWPSHGTQVADLVMGGPALRLKLPQLPRLVQLKIINIVGRTAGGAAEILEGNLLTGLKYAADQGVKVVNVSVSASANLQILVDSVRANPDLLLVVAAGNEDHNLSDFPSYPANYGGEGALASQVITVAAHDGKRQLAGFSNRDGSYADLAAPGCAIPYMETTANGASLFGTSFAAPIVSLTAGLLRSFGLDSPQAVKDRLYASANYSPGLEVRAQGTLDMNKALALFDDVLETPEGILYGVWQHDDTVGLCANREAFLGTRISKVTVLTSAEKSILRILYRDGANKIKPIECTAAGDGLLFGSDGSVPKIRLWTQILDLVPRYYPDDPAVSQTTAAPSAGGDPLVPADAPAPVSHRPTSRSLQRSLR